MNYNIKGTAVVITPELRSYVEKRLQHAEKFMRADKEARADIELQFAQGDREKKYRAEFTITQGGDTYRVEHRGDSLHEAIDIASQEIARELTQEKKKKLHMLRHSAGKVKDFLRGFRKDV